MDDRCKQEMLRHFLGALAYRTQAALRGAPESFAVFEAGNLTRTPKDVLEHMTSVLGYARAFFRGGSYRPTLLATFQEETSRFHAMLADLSRHLEEEDELVGTTLEQLLQGPFSDAMTHAGQLAMLRRLHGSPIPPENFIVANIEATNVSPDQPEPRSPEVPTVTGPNV